MPKAVLPAPSWWRPGLSAGTIVGTLIGGFPAGTIVGALVGIFVDVITSAVSGKGEPPSEHRTGIAPSLDSPRLVQSREVEAEAPEQSHFRDAVQQSRTYRDGMDQQR